MILILICGLSFGWRCGRPHLYCSRSCNIFDFLDYRVIYICTYKTLKFNTLEYPFDIVKSPHTRTVSQLLTNWASFCYLDILIVDYFHYLNKIQMSYEQVSSFLFLFKEEYLVFIFLS